MIKNVFGIKTFFSKNKTVSDESNLKENNKPSVEETEEEYTFESTARAEKKADKDVARNMLLASLMALSTIGGTFGYALTSDMEDSQGKTAVYVINEDERELLNKADSLSKEGKYSDVLEQKEFDKLLDYSKLADIPELVQREIKVQANSSYSPVKMSSINADRETLKQIKNVQYYINRLAEEYKNNPPKSSDELYREYALKNVTDKEILDKVDFSELEHYQKDLTVVKARISFSREKIKRDDFKSSEKIDKQVENAQRLVDKIVQQYKTRAEVSGNYDGDHVLTAGELISLLDLTCLENLPEQLQYRIIQKAIEGYKPHDLSYVKDKKQVEIANEKVEQDRAKAQQKLDEWAFRAQKEFYHLLHPNEVKLVSTDVAQQQ